MRRWSLIFLSGVLCGATATFACIRYSRVQMMRTTKPVLEVNGSVVTNDQFVSRLKGKSGGQVLAEMTQQTLVFQEAGKQNITLTDKEEEFLVKHLTAIDNPDVKAYLDAEARSQVLLRKLILKDVTEEYRRRLYDLYTEELAQYEIFVVVVATKTEADTVWQKLHEHILTFEQVVSTYSLAQANGGRVGYLSLPAIHRQFGEVAAETISKLAPNSVLKPITCPEGMAVIRLGSVLKSYEEVKPFIDNIIVDARRVAFGRKLLTGAKISSTMLDTSMSARKGAERIIFDGGTSSPDSGLKAPDLNQPQAPLPDKPKFNPLTPPPQNVTLPVPRKPVHTPSPGLIPPVDKDPGKNAN